MPPVLSFWFEPCPCQVHVLYGAPRYYVQYPLLSFFADFLEVRGTHGARKRPLVPDTKNRMAIARRNVMDEHDDVMENNFSFTLSTALQVI